MSTLTRRTFALPACLTLAAGLGLLALIVNTSARSDSDDTPASAPAAELAHVDGNVPVGEIEQLHAVASQHPAVADFALASAELELAWASVHGDSKDSGCPTEASCATLTYYAWDLASALTATVNREAGVVVREPESSARVHLTARMRERAIAIALADPDVAASIADGAEVFNVAESAGYGSCAANLCAVVVFSTLDGLLSGSDGLAVQVDLNRQLVVYGETVTGTIDRRFD